MTYRQKWCPFKVIHFPFQWAGEYSTQSSVTFYSGILCVFGGRIGRGPWTMNRTQHTHGDTDWECEMWIMPQSTSSSLMAQLRSTTAAHGAVMVIRSPASGFRIRWRADRDRVNKFAGLPTFDKANRKYPFCLGFGSTATPVVSLILP